MGLNGRVVKLESRLAATVPADDSGEQLWARFFASARRWTEDGQATEDQILEADRMTARKFFAYCQSTGVTPTIATLNKWTHC